MESAFKWMAQMAPATIVVKAIIVSSVGICALMVFILARRWLRTRYFARRDRLIFALRQRWDDLLQGVVLPQKWRSDPLTCEVLESMLLDAIEVSSGDELRRLVRCLRRHGILDRRIAQVRDGNGWVRWRALVALGRTRAPEAVPALAEALDSGDMETRIAAVRGIGKLGLPEAAIAILDRLSDGRLLVPASVLKNALVNCCAAKPGILLGYVLHASGPPRELLARVLAELAPAPMSEEFLVLSADPSAEVRAAAARALAHSDQKLALPPLAQLAADGEWFVRLRAVVALGSFSGSEVITVLIRSLSDPNRLVRQRAAWALMNSGEALARVLRQVIEAGDNYGLQAVVAELEQAGHYFQALAEVKQQAGLGAERLVDALQEARNRLALQPAGDTKEETAGVAS